MNKYSYDPNQHSQIVSRRGLKYLVTKCFVYLKPMTDGVNVILRLERRCKLKKYKRNIEKILESPLYRGVKLWDMIHDIQRSLTKVKFKLMLKLIKL